MFVCHREGRMCLCVTGKVECVCVLQGRCVCVLQGR